MHLIMLGQQPTDRLVDAYMGLDTGNQQLGPPGLPESVQEPRIQAGIEGDLLNRGYIRQEFLDFRNRPSKPLENIARAL